MINVFHKIEIEISGKILVYEYMYSLSAHVSYVQPRTEVLNSQR